MMVRGLGCSILASFFGIARSVLKLEAAFATPFTDFWAHLPRHFHRLELAMRLQQIHPQRRPTHLRLHLGSAKVPGSGQVEPSLHGPPNACSTLKRIEPIFLLKLLSSGCTGLPALPLCWIRSPMPRSANHCRFDLLA